MTGANLERDVLPWMDGDTAFFFRLLEEEISPLGYIPDIGVIAETSNPAATRQFLASLQQSFAAYGIPFTGDSDEISTTLAMSFIRDLINPIIPPDAPNLDVLIAANEDVFAFGTRAAVEAGLNPNAENSLATDAGYVAAQSIFLPGAQQIVYINPVPIRDILAKFDTRDAAQARVLLSFFRNMTLSASVSEDGSSVARFTISFNDELPSQIEVPPARPTIGPTIVPMLPTATPASGG